MKILIVCASLEVAWGGPPKVAVRLAEELERMGWNCVIATTRPTSPSPEVATEVDVKAFERSPLSRAWTSHSLGIRKHMDAMVAEADVIHTHELWHYPQYAALRAARRAGKPSIVTVHGNLAPHALAHDAWKKAPFWRYIQRPLLRSATAIHAFTNVERDDIRHAGLENEIAVIPNGVDTAAPSQAEVDEFAKRFPELNGKVVLLFLGRFHPVKQLDLLVKSFVRARQRPGAERLHLVLAGPDQYGQQTELEKILESAGERRSVTFTGPLAPSEAAAALASATVYVQTSRTEASSMSILEAAAAGKPMVLTTGCAFPEAEGLNLGRVVEPNVEALASALLEVVGKAKEGALPNPAGVESVRRDRSWTQSATQLNDVLNRATRQL